LVSPTSSLLGRRSASLRPPKASREGEFHDRTKIDQHDYMGH